VVSRLAERHAARATPGTSPSRWLSPEAVAAVALVCLYLVVASGHLQSIDGLVVYRQGVSLAYHQSLHWSPAILWGDARTTSSYGIGLSLLYIPGLTIFSWLQPHLPVPHGAYDFSLLYSDPLWPLAGMPVQILVVAAGAYLVARLIRALGFSTGPALWGLVLFGIGSPAIVYARADTAQLVEGLCWIGAIYGAIRFRQTDRQRWLWGCGFALFFALLTRPLEGLLIAPAAAALVVPNLRPWHWTRTVWMEAAIIGGWLAAAVAVTLAVNVGRFGAPLTFGSPTSWTTPLPVGLAGALVSPARGMLWAFPAIVLVPVGLARLWRTGYRWVAAVITALCLALLLNVSLWTWWWGGWSWGLRLFLPALPLLAVLAAAGIAALPVGLRRWLPGLLLAGGMLWAAPGVLTDILGGYAGTYNGTAPSFRLDGYPPIGAWTFLHHWRAQAPTDSATADILWLRLSRLTHNLSLIPPILLAAVGTALLIPVRRLARTS
jgi:Dolichyl-phosphate-mannose-protein mannosyltransferase